MRFSLARQAPILERLAQGRAGPESTGDRLQLPEPLPERFAFTWDLVLALGIILLELLAVVARRAGLAVPPPVSAGVAIAVVLVCPGLLFGRIVLRHSPLDPIQRLGLAFGISLGLLVPAGWTIMMVHRNLTALGGYFCLLMVVLGVLGLWFSRRNPNEDGQQKFSINLPLFVSFVCLLVAIFLLAAGGTFDGDTLTQAAVVRVNSEAPRLSVEEQLFGAGLPVNPRIVYNTWFILPAFIGQLAGLDPVALLHDYLVSYLAVFTLLALYALMTELSGSSNFGLFTSCLEALYVLIGPFQNEFAANESSIILRRIVADKFILLYASIPAALFFATRYVKTGERRYLVLTLVSGLGIAMIHPLDYVFLATAVGFFFGLHYLLERKREVLLRALAVGGVVLALAIFPLILAIQVLSDHSSSLGASGFGQLGLVRGVTLVLPKVWMSALELPGSQAARPPTVTGVAGVGGTNEWPWFVDSPTFGKPPSTPGAAAPDRPNPFLLARVYAQLSQQKLLILSDRFYLGDPAALANPGTALAVVLVVPLIFLIRRNLLARYLLGLTVGCLFLGFNPVVSPLVGRLVTPWELNRFAWSIPVVPILAFYAFGPIQWAMRRLGRWGAPLPVVALGALAIVTWPNISSHAQSLIADTQNWQPFPVGAAAYLHAHPPAPGDVVLADYQVGQFIKVVAAKPDIIAQRVNTTGEEFPGSRQKEAVQRQSDLINFGLAPRLDSKVVGIMQRYPSRYVLLRSYDPLACQLDHLPTTFTLRDQDPRYRLYERTGNLADLTTSPLIRGNDALNAHDLPTATREFQSSLGADPNNVFALLGLADAQQQQGQIDDALASSSRATAIAGDGCSYLALGAAQEAAADGAAARVSYTAGLGREPNNKLLLLSMGDFLASELDLVGAARFYNAAAAVDFHPDTVSYYQSLGQILSTRHLPTQTELAHVQLVTLAPSYANWLTLGDSRLRQDNWDGAAKAYNEARRLVPWNPTGLSRLGDTRQAANDAAGAQALYQRALNLGEIVLNTEHSTRLALGHLYQETNRPDAARTQYMRAAQIMPYNWQPYVYLGRMEEFIQSYSAAEADYRTAIKVAPNSADGSILLGHLLMQRGRAEEARQSFEAAIKIDPYSPVAWEALGTFYRDRGELAKSTAVLAQGLDKRPDDLLTRLSLGKTLRLSGESRLALGQYQIAVHNFPASGPAHTELGTIYRERGDLPNAFAQYSEAATSDPIYPGSYLAQGDTYLLTNQTDKAVESYKRAIAIASIHRTIQLYPTVGSGYDRLGRAYVNYGPFPSSQQGQDPNSGINSTGDLGGGAQAAVDSLLQAAKLEPVYLPSHLALEQAYLKLGQTDNAVQQLQIAADAKVDSSIVYDAIGQLRLTEGNWPEAQKAYEHALKVKPDDATAVLGLGQVLLAQGQPARAMDYFHQAIILEPGRDVAYVHLSLALRQVGDPTSALHVAQQATTRMPGSLTANLAVGDSYAALGKFAEARGAYNRAIQLYPGIMDGYERLGSLDRLLNNPAASEADFKRAAAIDQGRAAPLKKLADLYITQARFDDAISVLQGAERIEPGDETTYHLLAKILGLRGRNAEATAQLQKAAQLNQSLAATHVALAKLLVQVDNYAGAQTQLSIATNLDQLSVEALLAQAQFQQAQAHPAEEMQILETAVQRDPGNVLARDALSKAQTAAGHLDQALATDQQGIAATPGAAKAYITYGRDLLFAGRWDDALASFRKGTEVAPADVEAWIALANAYRGRDQRDQAIEAYQHAIQMNPGAGRPQTALGTGLLAMGRLSDANQAFTEAVTKEPGSAPAYDGLGLTLEKQGDYAGAAEAFQKAIALEPTVPAAYTHLSAIYRKLQRPDDALATLRRSVAIVPGDPSAYLDLGTALKDIDQRGQAIDVYQKGLGVQPGDTRLGVALAVALLELDRANEAAAVIDQTLKIKPGDVKAQVVAGKIQERKRQWQAAEQTFRQAALFDLANAEADVALGGLMELRGSPNDAIAAYGQAIAADPMSAIAQSSLGHAYLRYGPTNRADEIFRAMVVKFQADAVSFRGLGDTYRHKGDLTGAIRAYSDGVSVAPHDAAALVVLAAGYTAAGDDNAALQTAQLAIQADPSSLTARLAVAHELLARGDLDGALQGAQAAVAAYPEHPGAYVALAGILRKRQEFPPAEAAVAKALSLDSNDITAWIERGGLAAEQHQPAAATAAYDQAVALAPGDAKVWITRGRFLLARENYSGALDAFTKAASASSGDSIGYVAVSDLYRAELRWNEALAAAEKAVAADPGQGDGYTARGLALEGLQRISEAKDSFQTSTRVHPGFTAAYLRLGQLQERQADFTGAIASYQKVNALPTSGAAGHDLLGHLYLRIGPTDQAMTTFQAALKRDPRSAAVYVGIGDVYKHQGAPKDALAQFQKAIDAQPLIPLGYLALGDAKLASADYAGARAAYEKALAESADEKNGDPGVLDRLAAFESRLGASSADQALAHSQASVAAEPYTPGVLARLGNLLAARGQYEAADQAYQAALKLDPRSVAALDSLGKFQELKRQGAAARAAHQAAMKARPDDPVAWDSWGAFLLTQNDRAGADAAFTQAVALAPNEAVGYIGRGRVAEAQLKYDVAQAFYRKGIAVQPGSGAAHVALGRSLAITQPSAAAAEFQEALRVEPNFDAAYVAWGELQVKQANFSGAIATYQKDIALQTSGPTGYLHLGDLYLRIGPTQQAMATLQTGLKRDPRSAALIVAIGHTYRHQGRLSDAIATYQAATQAQPYESVGYLALADGKVAAADFAGARVAFDKALALSRNTVVGDATVLDALAAYETRLGAPGADQALAHARASVAADPYSSGAQLRVGHVLLGQGQYDAAEQAYLASAKLSPKPVGSLIALGHLYEVRQQLDQARAKFVAATEADPNDAAAWHAYAGFLLKLRDWAGAQAATERGNALLGNKAAGYETLGKIAEAQLKYDEAQAFYRKGIAVEPGSASVHVALARSLALTQPSAAPAEFQEALRVEPNSDAGYLGWGEFLIKQADFPGAAALYQKDIAHPTSGATGYVHLGDLYLRIGPTDQALATFQAGLQREPRSATVLVGIGHTYRHQGRMTDAIATYQKAIQAEPTSPLGYVALGDGKVAVGDFAAARQNFQIALGYLKTDLNADLAATARLAQLESRVGNTSTALALARESVANVTYRAEPNIVLGNLLVQQEQYDAADQAYRAALTIDPKSVAAVHGLARIRHIKMLHSTLPADIARYQADARAQYQAALTISPNDPAAWHAWAIFLSSQKEWAAADAAAQKAIALAPNNAASYLERARIAESQGQDGTAQQFGRQGVAVEPGSGAAHVALAKELEGVLPDEARAQFNEALRVEPGNGRAYLELGDFLQLVGDLPGALGAYRQDSVLQPTSAAGKLRAADAYFLSGDSISATQMLQAVLNSGVNQPPIQASLTYRHVGDMYIRLHQPFLAISPYYKAKDLNPAGVGSYAALAHALVLLNRNDEAIALADSAVGNNPNSAAALIVDGEAYASRGQTPQAIALYSRALALDPTFSKGYFAFARAVDPHHTNSGEGIALFQQGLSANPTKDFRAYQGLVKLYGTSHVWLATQVYGNDAGSTGLLWPTMSLASSYLVSAQIQSAADTYDLAQLIAPDFLHLYCERGSLEQQLGHYDTARHLLGICIDLSTGPQTVAAARSSLQIILRNGQSVRLSSPANGAVVSGVVTVSGTAADLNFQSYKLEYHPAADASTWFGIGDVVNHPVQNGVLGTWDTRGKPPGDYVLRLVVVDQTGQFSAPVQVTVHVK